MFKVGDKVTVYVDGLDGYDYFPSCYLNATIIKILLKGRCYKVTITDFPERKKPVETISADRIFPRFEFPNKKIKYRKGQAVVVDWPDLSGWWEGRVLHDTPKYTTLEWDQPYEDEQEVVTIWHRLVIPNPVNRKRKRARFSNSRAATRRANSKIKKESSSKSLKHD